jgi:hypothetical protein
VFEGYGISAGVGLFVLVPACVAGGLVATTAAPHTSRVVRVLFVIGIVALELAVTALSLSLLSGSLQGVVPMLQLLTYPGFAAGGVNPIAVLYVWVPLLALAGYVVLARKPRVPVAACLAPGLVAIGIAVIVTGGVMTNAGID